MERMQARINTYVPEKLKSRLDRLADASGLKSSDLVRLSLSFAVQHFEENGIELSTKGGRGSVKNGGRGHG